jgi:hypothetical protein
LHYMGNMKGCFSAILRTDIIKRVTGLDGHDTKPLPIRLTL